MSLSFQAPTLDRGRSQTLTADMTWLRIRDGNDSGLSSLDSNELV